MGQFRKYPALADRLRAIGIELQGRDVVQPRLERQEEVFNARALSDFLQFVQRNRLFFGERAGLDAPQIGDMPQRSKRACDIPCKLADVGTLRHMRHECDAVCQFQRGLRIVRIGAAGGGGKSGPQFTIFAVAFQVE